MKAVIFLFLILNSVFAAEKTLTYDFNQGLQGWSVGFADYPEGQEEFHELLSKITKLPAEISETRKGLLISGNNHSDDLYMYMTKKIGADDGLVAGKTYEIRYRVTLASNAPTGCIGAGGAPGESVFLKGSVLKSAPETLVDSLGVVRTRFNHGGTISDIANGIECEEATGNYVSLVKTQSSARSVKVGKDGNLWLALGTDSGFESTTALYYQKIEVILRN